MYISIPAAIFITVVLILFGMFLMAIILGSKSKPVGDQTIPEDVESYQIMFDNLPQWKKDLYSKKAAGIWEKVKDQLSPEEN